MTLSAELLGLAVESSPHAVLAFDAEDRVALANAAARALLAKDRASLLGALVSEVLCAREDALAPSRLRERARGGDAAFECVLQQGSASGQLLSVRVASLESSVLLFLEDLTERRLREDMAEKISDIAQAGLVTIDAQQRILSMNPSAERIFGYEPGELLGQPLSKLVPEAHRPMHASRVHALTEGAPMPESNRVPGRRKDGGEVHLEIHFRRASAGDKSHFLAVLRDTTERDQMLARLQDSEQRLASIFQFVPVGLVLMRVPDFVVLEVNDAYLRIVDLTREQVVGHHYREFVPNPEATARLEVLFRSQGYVYNEPYHYPHRDGAHADGLVSSHVFLIGGVPYALITVVDITARVEMEAKLHQSQKMESLGRLAGGVAHDFNNWLTVITGNVELLEAELEGESILELLRDIRSATDRATSLTRELLAFSRRERVEKRLLDLNDVVRESVKMLGRLLGEDIHIEVRLVSRSTRVFADRGQLLQVLMNLSVNARDAMRAGGELRLSTSRVMLGRDAVPEELAPGAFIVLEVADSGAGMTPEVLARIFEPFFTTKGAGQGTGLGLAVVHGIVAANGGFLTVSSEPGRGSAFRVHLPERSSAVTLEPRAIPAEDAARPGETVLVVEDEESVRKLAVRALESAGFTVLSAPGGDEALALLERQERPVHLLLTDVVMPKMNGAQVAALVRERSPQTRVLYTSGYTDDAVLEHGVASDSVAFLPKPYTRSELLRRVRSVLDG